MNENDCPDQSDLDFHETHEGEFFATGLGHIILQWNFVEHSFSALIWQIVGDIDKGMAITSALGNVSRKNLLATLSGQIDHDPDLNDAIRHACECFDILRDTRNILVHSMRVDKENNDIVWTRVRGGGREGFSRSLCGKEEVFQTLQSLGALSLYVGEIYLYLSGNRDSLPAKCQRAGEALLSSGIHP